MRIAFEKYTTIFLAESPEDEKLVSLLTEFEGGFELTAASEEEASLPAAGGEIASTG